MEILHKSKEKLIVGNDQIKKIDGNKRRRVHAVITDPRSRHIILTRFPENHKVWFKKEILRGCDFIPSFILRKAKISNHNEYKMFFKNGDMIIKKTNKESVKPYSEEWEKEANNLARSFCPTIYPCSTCKHPVVSGYCCTYCLTSMP
jgi:hypothetical protein